MTTSRAAASNKARVDEPRSTLRPESSCSVVIRSAFSGRSSGRAAGRLASLLHRIPLWPAGREGALVMSGDQSAGLPGAATGVAGAPGVAGTLGEAAAEIIAMPEPGRHAPDRNLAMELARVTEAGAMASARWVGRGDKNGADGAAVNA